MSIYKYADANLHGEAQFDTMRGFLSHALTTLPDADAEKFIKSSSKALNDTVIFKELIRAGKYGLLNSGLMKCRNIDEHAPALFYYAAQHKDADAMHTLISRGADVNSNNGEALYTCYETNKLEAAKVLINYGADINYLTNYISQIKDVRPNIHFLQELCKHSGITENELDNKLQSVQETPEDEVVGEYGVYDGFDSSWE
ncbi:ankyrin repeat domain-containing protein [Ruminiclostridium josui]|uniref:ankyrin repeat domain-containing protein n=1 Tax=Ruminiclostridium josui TaxID=1499 RepID=UPI0004B40144|nr:ankyrin repeat domain-containing protein [Ruminiclostridium josui]